MLDGTLVRTHRIRAYDRRYYASKPHHHGVNLQELTDLHGRLIWIFDGLSGSTHDLSATHTHGVFTVADQAELHLYADKGYVDGAGATLLTPDQGRNLPDSARDANRCHAAVRQRRTRLRGPQELAGVRPVPRLPTPSRCVRPSRPHPRTRPP